MKQYQDLIRRILQNSTLRNDRTGVGTYSCFGESITMDLQDGFPIITARKINYKAAFGELAAFLKGSTKASDFAALGCNYWNAYGEDLGPIYGAQWRNFNGVDQLAELVHIIKTDPTSRRLILSTWNPSDLHKMCLPPCHITAQYYVDKYNLDCIVYMRSCDIMLGLPFDIIVYALLQYLIANETNLEPRKLTFMLGDAHIYSNHIDKARALLNKPTYDLPTLSLLYKVSLFDFRPEDAEIHLYESGPAMSFELNL